MDVRIGNTPTVAADLVADGRPEQSPKTKIQ
jgi:hypothetical protein